MIKIQGSTGRDFVEKMRINAVLYAIAEIYTGIPFRRIENEQGAKRLDEIGLHEAADIVRRNSA